MHRRRAGVGADPFAGKHFRRAFADVSAISTLYVSQFARTRVTIGLSSEGGVESFSGYGRCVFTWRSALALAMPELVRRALRLGLTCPSVQKWDQRSTEFVRVEYHCTSSRLGEKIHRGAELLTLAGVNALYRAVLSAGHEPARIPQAPIRKEFSLESYDSTE